jgi:hypothetical protein
MKSNTDMLLAKLEEELNHGEAVLALIKKSVEITALIDDTKCAQANAANEEDIARLQSLIESGNEAILQSKNSGHTFDAAHDMIGRQLKAMHLMLDYAREVTHPAAKVNVERMEVEEQVRKVQGRVSGIKEEIEKWGELKSLAEAELGRVLFLTTFAQINGRHVRALEKKHPGFFKDLKDLAKKSGAHNE